MTYSRAPFIVAGFLAIGIAAGPVTVAAQRTVVQRDAARESPEGWRVETVRFFELPEKVRDSFLSLAQTSRIAGFSRLSKDERTIYRAQFVDGERTRFVHIDENGNVVGQMTPREAGQASVRFDRLPEQVQRTLSLEARGRAVRDIKQVTSGNQTYYIATIDERSGIRVVRMDANGRLLQADDQVTINITPPEERRAREPERDRVEVNVAAGEDEGAWNEQEMSFDNLPGSVKQAAGRARGQDEIKSVTRLTRDGRTAYRVEVQGPYRARAIHLDDQGNIIGERNITDEGVLAVNFERLPGEVKNTLAKEAQGRPFKTIYQITEGNQTWYVAQIDARDGVRTVRVGSGGSLLAPDDVPLLLGDVPSPEDGWREEPIRFADVPPAVRQTFNRERAEDRIASVSRLIKDRRVVYRAHFQGTNRSRYVHVDEQGNVIGQRNLTEEGPIEVNFENLPAPVKETLGREVRGRGFRAIHQVTSGNKTWYKAVVDAPGGYRTIYVGSQGNLLSERELEEARD